MLRREAALLLGLSSYGVWRQHASAGRCASCIHFMDKPAAIDVNSREIRVFISSTFRDFMAERELLVKQVLPSLFRNAQERGLVRW